MNNFSFQNLLSKKARFLNAEDVSPSKLSGMAAQIENGFNILQNFLGNGTDNLRTSTQTKNVLFNISSAIGRGDKIYKPVNKFHSLEQIYNKYLSTQTAKCSYDAANDILTINASQSVTITSSIPSGNVVALLYSASQIATINDGVNATTNLTTTGGTYKWFYQNIGSSSAVITLTAGSTALLIKSFIVSMAPFNGYSTIDTININGSGSSTDYAVFNLAYSIPSNNASYFTVATPCVHSASCQNTTGNYCIGNTYCYDSGNVLYGSPICTGALAPGGAPQSYTADSIAKKTIQSPLLTANSPYGAKLSPFKIYDSETQDTLLPDNSLALYDNQNNTSPLFRNINFYAGSSTRGDIVWINDTTGISDSVNNNRYLLLNSMYGLSDFMWDLAGITKGY